MSNAKKNAGREAPRAGTQSKPKTSTASKFARPERSAQADSVGLLLDFEDPRATALLAGDLIKNRDALEGLRVLAQTGVRYGVAAGAVHRKHGGVLVIGAAWDGIEDVLRFVNARLAELGSASTAWIICALDQADFEDQIRDGGAT